MRRALQSPPNALAPQLPPRPDQPLAPRRDQGGTNKTMMPWVLAAFALACVALIPSGASQAVVPGVACSTLNLCSGHGTCNGATGECACQDGWGSKSDIASYKSPDCRFRTCPADRVWSGIPTTASLVHNVLAECSNMGVCNRVTGACECFPGFTGDACQRSSCPNDCSGHGKCMSIKQMQAQPNAEPFGHNDASYGGREESVTFDEDRIFGCVCDSRWKVGYGSGEVQATEWYGPDCGLRRCPSGDDPKTTRDSTNSVVDHQWLDETNCYLRDHNGTVWRGPVDVAGQPDYASNSVPATTVVFGTAPPAGQFVNAGAQGNKCHIDCSNRGVCDSQTGTCSCMSGSYGEACQFLSLRATGL